VVAADAEGDRDLVGGEAGGLQALEDWGEGEVDRGPAGGVVDDDGDGFGEGDSPILLRGLRKIGTVPGPFGTDSEEGFEGCRGWAEGVVEGVEEGGGVVVGVEGVGEVGVGDEGAGPGVGPEEGEGAGRAPGK
jgi:hypothetical protein